MGFWAYLAVAIITTVASYALAPKPKPPAGQGARQLRDPTAEAGIPIPVLFGEMRLQEPNVLWFGDTRIYESDTVNVYFASIHYGLAHRVDALTEIWYGEKLAWSGEVTTNTNFPIYRDGLFGGPKKEGGLNADFDVMLGGPAQTASDNLRNAYMRNGIPAGSAATTPAYRGVTTVLLHSFTDGGNIGSNTGYIKPIWFRCRRDPVAPFPAHIIVEGMRLANPAAIIWEAMTNREWGMGSPSSLLDQSSFAAAASILANEGFGIALLWSEQESVEDFIGEVLNHIEGTLALNPLTGQFRLRLVRDDYNPATLPVVSPENAHLDDWDRRGWGEVTNEINVSWTNPANEQQETVTLHNLAAINEQGGEIISDTQEYPGIRTGDLALRVCARDLRVAASTLASAEVRVQRTAWTWLVGDPVVLDWPELGSAIMRITDANYGSPGDPWVRLSLIEDVFALPGDVYAGAPGSGWSNPSQPPAPLEHERVTSAPYYFVARARSASAAAAVPAGRDHLLGYGTHADPAQWSVDLAVDEGGEWTTRASTDLASRALLAAPLSREAESFAPALASQVRPAEIGQPDFLVWIGPNTESAELAYVLHGGNWRRGVLDTVPREWPVGTECWFLARNSAHNSMAVSSETYAVGDPRSVKLLTVAGLGRLAPQDAATQEVTPAGRAARPYRPANVRIDGALWPDPELERDDVVTITWAGRDRAEELGAPLPWDDTVHVHEAGVTYEVVLYADNAGTLTEFRVEPVGTDTEWVWDPWVIPPPSHDYVVVEVRSRRSGAVSLPGMRHRLTIADVPYVAAPEIIDVLPVEE